MKTWFLLFALLLIGIYVATTSLVVVDAGEYVLITRFGSPERVIKQAGLHTKWPDPIETRLRFDRRLQGLETQVAEYLTADKKNLVAANYVLWQIADPVKFQQSVRTLNNAKARLLDLVTSEFGVAIGGYALSDLLNAEAGTKIPALMAHVTEKSQSKAQQQFGIAILDVRLQRLTFPEQTLESVYRRMRAERLVIANQYRAEGSEAATNLRSETELQVRSMLAEAKKEANIIEGEAEAQAIQIYAQSYELDPEFYQLTRTLSAYAKILDQQTTLVLSMDTPLFHLLAAPPDFTPTDLKANQANKANATAPKNFQDAAQTHPDAPTTEIPIGEAP